MNKKQIGAIYLITAVLVIVGMGYFMISSKDKDKGEDIKETTIDANLSVAEKESLALVAQMRDEIFASDNNPEFHRGEYPGRADSRELNPEFITDQTKIYDPFDGVEIEFLTYEELPDVSAYIKDKNFRWDYYEQTYLRDNLCNTDGTFNTFTYKYRDRLNDGVYGKEHIIEDYELVAVKIGIKLINKENNVNQIYLNELSQTRGFIYMDDGKLYRNSSVYWYENLTTYRETVYNPWQSRNKDPLNDGMSFELEPLEETEGELIYILGKQDLQDIYISIAPNSGDIENFNRVYTYFVPFKLLMNLPKE